MTDNLPAAPAAKSPIIKPLDIDSRDLVWMLCQDKRSPATRRAYKADLEDFFTGYLQVGSGQAAVQEFVRLPVPQISLHLALYQEQMRTRHLAPATSNRRKAALCSLLKMCYRLGISQTDGRNLVDAEKSKAYRDTRGTDVVNMKRLLALPDRATIRGKRDYAILRLLCDNALRRAEVCALNVADFRPEELRLAILGKGRGTEKEWVTLHPSSAAAIAQYLMAAGYWDGALFVTCDHRPHLAGARLGATGLYDVVATYGQKLGLKLTPHKLRHSAITAALDKTGGDVRWVQKLSRHAKLETLTIYDDNRADHQGEITMLLGDLLDG